MRRSRLLAAVAGALAIELLLPATLSSAPTGMGPARLFAGDSFFNRPIPPDATVDPRTGFWLRLLSADPRVGDIAVNDDAWTVAVYHAPAGTPTTSIYIRNSGKRITIPYLPSFRPTRDADAHLAVIDTSTGCEYEFQAFDPVTRSAHASATYKVYSGTGAHAAGPGHSGGELSYLGGLITPADVASGSIDHALRFALPVNSPEFVPPATRSDGILPGGVPEGIRIRLDPALDLGQFGLDPFQTMVARALQTYGAFNADHSDSFALYAQSRTDGSRYVHQPRALPRALLAHVQFLNPTLPGLPRLDTATDTTCAQQH